MADNMTWLPPRLLASAYRAAGEMAWPRADALEVIDHLSQHNIAAPGGEIWLPTRPGPTIPTPYIYTWDAGGELPGESWAEFVERVNRVAREYIASFAWTPEDHDHAQLVPYFNLMLQRQEEDRSECFAVG